MAIKMMIYRFQVLFSLSAMVFVGSLASPMSAAPGYDEAIAPFLRSYCADCHTAGAEEGNFALDKLTSKVTAEDQADQWLKVHDKLLLKQMPPEDADQPDEAMRQRVVGWIRSELRKGGVHASNKLLDAGYGNYVPHASLFGSKPNTLSVSPPRYWRIRPEAYQERMNDIVREQFIRPFDLNSAGAFGDFARDYKLAGPDVELLINNARAAAVRLSSIEVKDGELRGVGRTPKEHVELLNPKNPEPSAEQWKHIIQRMYHNALSREPSDEELQQLLQFAQQSAEQGGRTRALRNVIAAVLLTPEALYRFEIGGGKPDEHGRVKLTPRELAYAISYALTNEGPVGELLHDAEDGKLTSPEDVRRHVERLLADKKTSKPRILEFFREYFDYPAAVDVFKDENLFKDHEPGVLVSDTDRLVEYVLKQDQDVLKTLLTTNKSFVNWGHDSREEHKPAKREMIHLAYSLPPDWKWTNEQPIELPDSQRAGILTQPSWLVAHSDNFDNHAIRRGHWIRERLLGGTVPDLPITVDAQLPDDPSLTLRERMEITTETYCWQCHRQMNPLGLPFEQFDHFGRWRTRELGKPVDTTGTVARVESKDIVGDVKDPIEMIHRLAESEHVRQVFVRHAFRYWMGRNETPLDAATLQRADADYVNSGGSMNALIASLLTSDSFLYRMADTAQANTE